ncbi:MAG: Gfo/Idh/MocA family oxidoreductase [Bryobacter sp.]|nr:Gfo/Idh/MocA family oxidoreductase [Bryobacter sp.]
MEKRTLRGGLIGCGFFGQIQLEAWRRMEGVEIVAAADSNQERAQTSALRGYATAEEMLEREELDFVDIATRPDTHLPLLELALTKNLAVIVQKPLAPSLGEAWEMVKLAQGRRVMAHENWRWQPWHREMKRRLAAGDIGAPVAYHLTMTSNDGFGPTPYPNQPYFKDMPRLLMFESLIHPVDVARFWFGAIEKVFAVARRRNPGIAGEDRAVVTLVHAALEGVVEGHRFALPEPPGPAMGHALVEGEEGHLRVWANGHLYRGSELVWRNTVEAGYKGDSVKATQEHFVECLREGKEFETNLMDYWESVLAIEAAYESVRSGRLVTLSEYAAGRAV